MTTPAPLDDEPTPVVVEAQSPRVPYPGFCSHEPGCAGASYCPRDPTCID